MSNIPQTPVNWQPPTPPKKNTALIVVLSVFGALGVFIIGILIVALVAVGATQPSEPVPAPAPSTTQAKSPKPSEKPTEAPKPKKTEAPVESPEPDSDPSTYSTEVNTVEDLQNLLPCNTVWEHVESTQGFDMYQCLANGEEVYLAWFAQPEAVPIFLEMLGADPTFAGTYYVTDYSNWALVVTLENDANIAQEQLGGEVGQF